VVVRARERTGLDAWRSNHGNRWIGSNNGYPHTSIFYTNRRRHFGARYNDPADVSYTFTTFHYSTNALTHYHYDETTPNHWERRNAGYYPAAADVAANQLMATIGGTLDARGTHAAALVAAAAALAAAQAAAAAAAQAAAAQQQQQPQQPVAVVAAAAGGGAVANANPGP
jgi:hypothetical protein